MQPASSHVRPFWNEVEDSFQPEPMELDAPCGTSGNDFKSKADQLSEALQALYDDTINGHQVLLFIREWGVIKPRSLLERVFRDVDVDNISDEELEAILGFDGKLAASIPKCRHTKSICLAACSGTHDSYRNIVYFEPAVRLELLPELIKESSLIIQYLNENELTFDLCRLAVNQEKCAYLFIPGSVFTAHPELLDFLKVHTFERIADKVPDTLKTKKFFLKMVDQNSFFTDDSFFKQLPEELKHDKQFYLDLCEKSYRALEYVPEELCNKQLYELAVNSNWMAIKLVPSSVSYYETLCRGAISKNGLALAYIDRKSQFINYDFYIEACENLRDGELVSEDQYNILHFIPKRFRSDELCRLVLKKCTKNVREHLKYLPDELKADPKICEQAVICNSLNIAFVPEHNKSLKICRLAADNNGSLYNIPGSMQTKEFLDEFIRRLSDKGGVGLTNIPKDARTCKHCQIQLMAKQSLYTVLTAYKELGPVESRKPLLSYEVIASLDLSIKLELLNAVSLDSVSRKRLLDSLKPDNRQPFPNFEPCPREKLYEVVKPSDWNTHNPFLPELVATAYNAVDFSPVRLHEGEALNSYVLNNSKRILTVMPDTEPLQSASTLELIGGRTLKVTQNGEHYFYKFQRTGETQETLVSEGLVHEYISGVKPSIGSGLKSNMPFEPVYFKIPADWLKRLPGFRDSPAIVEDEHGNKWLNVYRYKADAGYGIYAHQPDSTSLNPKARPEQGLLRASSDIGRFTAMGLIPTSLLAAYHNTGSGRRWVALHSVMGYTPCCAGSGTFAAWNTVATEYCDIGYSGFRDVADYETFGSVTCYLNQRDTKKYCHVPEVTQRLMLANSCVENLLAVILVYARLSQQFPDYHYKNETALKHTQCFVEQAFTEFLKGYYPQWAGESECFNLKTFMGLSETDYQNWLDRSIKEIIYWTAAQPRKETPQTPAFYSPDHDHSDCYALHLQENQFLATELYPYEHFEKRYPEDYHNIHGNLSLGASNSIFTLVSLSRGLTLLATRILATNL